VAGALSSCATGTSYRPAIPQSDDQSKKVVLVERGVNSSPTTRPAENRDPTDPVQVATRSPAANLRAGRR